MSYQQILDKNENQYIEINNAMFGKVVAFFQKESTFDIQRIIYESGIPKDNQQAFWTLYNYLLNHSSEEMQKMDKILDQFGFNLKRLLGSYIRLLGSSITETIPAYIYDALLRVPMIDALECKKGKITIHSDKLGSYSFTPIKKYFECSRKISIFLKFEPYENNCHNASWHLIEHLKNATLITLLTPSYFKGTNYHTVIQDEQNHILDIAHASVFEPDTFNQLMEGTVVCETKSSEIYEKLAEASENTGYANALVLALHHQSKL